jgi:CubicO group peptidase (beta-lactamase class C family)
MRLPRLAAVALLAIVLLAVVPPAAAQRPADPAWPRVEALLAVVASGDSAAARRFVGEHLAPSFAQAVPLEAHLRALAAWHRDWPAAEVRDVRRERDGELVVGLGAGGRRGRLVVAHEAAAPYRITGLRLLPDEPPLGANLDSPAELERRLDSLARLDRFSGTVLVARGERVLSRRGYGLADRDAATPMTPETRLNLGSITKAFTQVAILRLAQEGRLALDDPMGRYVDGFPADVAARVTLRMLLQHRSGMGDFFPSPAFRAAPQAVRTLDDYLRIARATPLEFEPGVRERYSNLGYVVLGAVLERASGLPWHDAIRRYVYEPAGMTASAALPWDAPGIARGYVGAPPALERNLATLPGMGSPAGGTYGTVDDLHRFALALAGRRLLDARHTALWFNEFEEGREGWGPVGIAGGAPGINAELVFDPRSRDVVVVMANRSPPAAAQVAQQLERELRGWKETP